jgi:hypothetical protein
MRHKVVPSSWLGRDGLRLGAAAYTSGAVETRLLLDRLSAPKVPLETLTKGYQEGIYRPPIFGMQFSRNLVYGAERGVPFMTGSSMQQADLSAIPRVSRELATSKKFAMLRLVPGMTLISCSGTVGRTAYSRPDMDGIWSSQDIMKVVPNCEKISSGYLFAYLSSRFGIPLITRGTYGGVVQHIEREHLLGVPVPRFQSSLESKVHALVAESSKLLAKYQADVNSATKRLFESVGLEDITAADWHLMGRDLGFTVTAPSVVSLRALNFTPRFQRLVKAVKAAPHKPLGELVIPGTLQRGARFKRIDAAPEYSYQLVGQRELFWVKPEGRWIAKSAAGKDVLVAPGTILVAARGTLGESELYCRGEFIWGPATRLAYSEDLLRVIADPKKVPTGCLYAFIRSETAFRMLRSISTGTKLQDHHRVMLAALPVPLPEPKAQQEIHNLVVEAYEARHKAVALEDEAIALVEGAIEEGAN